MWLFIKKFWYLLVISGLLIFIGLSGMISRCQDEHVEVVVEQVDTSVLKQQLTDSLNRIYSAREKTRLDSVNRVSKKTVDKLKKDVADLENTLIAELAEYDQDTAAQSMKCDKALLTQRLIIDKLYEEVRLISNMNKNLNLKISIDSVEYLGCKKSLNLAYGNINDLKDVIAAKTNWWDRNEKYVYAGVGIVGTLTVLKILAGLF